MKKVWFKKTLSAVLCACMTLSLTACGGGSGKSTETGGSGTSADEAKRYFRADYLDNLPDGMTGENAGSVVFYGDKVFYSEYSDDYTQQTIYAYDVLTGEDMEYCTFKNGSGSDADIYAESTSLSQFTPTADGSILLLSTSSQLDASTVDTDKYANTTKEDLINFIYSDWGFDTYQAAEEYFDNYIADTITENNTYGDLLLSYEATSDNYIRHTYLSKIDATGAEVYKSEIDAGPDNSYCNAIGSDADGNVYLAIDEWSEEGDSDTTYILVFDGSGNAIGRIDCSTSYISKLTNTADGRCGYLQWGSDGEDYVVCVLDPAELKVSEEITVGSGYVYDCVALDDHTFLFRGEKGLKQYDTTTQESTTYLNWMDCNISSNSVTTFGVLSDGRVAVYLQTWGSSSYTTDIAILNEISADEANSVKEINVTCFYLDSNMEAAAIDFNKKHTDYHININEYYDYEDSDVDYQDALDSFATAIATDSSIDVVAFTDYSQMLDFAAKGLLVDLNSVLADDPDLGNGKIVQNVLNACTFEGSLVALPTSFSVTTLVGKVSDVGTTPGWTLSDLMALYNTKDPDTQILSWYTRERIFNMCISLGYDEFLDLENKTCNFNNQDFIDILEFASLFPEEYNYDEETDETDLMHNGKILLYETSLPDFGQTQMLANIFGDDLTYIGYPNSSGNGSMMYLSNLSGITKYCEEPDIAWEFLRETYLQSYESDGSWFSGSILQSDFDKFFEDCRNEDYYNGTWGWGNYETTIHVPSQEEVDQVKDIILNSTAVNDAVSSGILNIIEEEAAAYFSGQKTAADVAANIQSRMEIYLSETM
jgi:ABC-type glycerol-3-phosphate transport system substrate-binding protein